MCAKFGLDPVAFLADGPTGTDVAAAVGPRVRMAVRVAAYRAVEAEEARRRKAEARGR